MTDIQRHDLCAARHCNDCGIEEHHTGDYVLFADHQARIDALEAKLAKAIDVITCILATAYADDHTGWHNALDDARATLKELETKP